MERKGGRITSLRWWNIFFVGKKPRIPDNTTVVKLIIGSEGRVFANYSKHRWRLSALRRKPHTKQNDRFTVAWFRILYFVKDHTDKC